MQAAQPREAAAESDARVRPLVAAVLAVASPQAAALQQEAVAAVPGAVLPLEEAAVAEVRAVAQQPAVAVEPGRDVGGLRPVAGAAGPQAP